MTMGWIDWSIVVALLIVLTITSIRTNRYARSVSGFLAANRCAGRYLITIAYGMAQLGVISLVWFWQQNYDVGFTSIWWGFMEGPALILIALTGWVVYRFRQTRAMTMAQFFEIRYSRNFRVFAGLVAFVSGIINYGIFPAVAARFFMHLCGLPEAIMFAGFEVGIFPLLMAGLLGTALLFVFLGGQIAVMVTDFIQGSFGNIVFLAVIFFLLFHFGWDRISAAMLEAPPGRSMVDPFDLGKEENFNVWYWVISVIVLFYGMLGWQGTSGYNASALNAHEAKMSNILNGWRFRVLMLITIVLPICIKVMMTDPAHAEQAIQIQAFIDQQPTQALGAEIRTPVATSMALPAGLLGLMCAAMLGAFISTNDTYLHAWGTIFVQDVILPFRRSRSPKASGYCLSILGVAIFAFFFSLLYTPTQYIAMFLAITGAIFVGGAGSAIIGGLYWKRHDRRRLDGDAGGHDVEWFRHREAVAGCRLLVWIGDRDIGCRWQSGCSKHPPAIRARDSARQVASRRGDAESMGHHRDELPGRRLEWIRFRPRGGARAQDRGSRRFRFAGPSSEFRFQ